MKSVKYNIVETTQTLVEICSSTFFMQKAEKARILRQNSAKKCVFLFCDQMLAEGFVVKKNLAHFNHSNTHRTTQVFRIWLYHGQWRLLFRDFSSSAINFWICNNVHFYNWARREGENSNTQGGERELNYCSVTL